MRDEANALGFRLFNLPVRSFYEVFEMTVFCRSAAGKLSLRIFAKVTEP
jgi:hypothetical protein